MRRVVMSGHTDQQCACRCYATNATTTRYKREKHRLRRHSNELMHAGLIVQAHGLQLPFLRQNTRSH